MQGLGQARPNRGAMVKFGSMVESCFQGTGHGLRRATSLYTREALVRTNLTHLCDKVGLLLLYKQSNSLIKSGKTVWSTVNSNE